MVFLQKQLLILSLEFVITSFFFMAARSMICCGIAALRIFMLVLMFMLVFVFVFMAICVVAVVVCVHISGEFFWFQLIYKLIEDHINL